jgi:hypothetical protein
MFAVNSAPLHEDTVLILKKNGALIGLPDKYSPASFDRTNLILRVAGNSIKIPDCISKHFKNEEKFKFSFTASWYHSKFNIQNYKSLPDYMSLNVYNENSIADFQILFNLETLDIIEMNMVEKNVSKNGVDYSLYNKKIEIPNICKGEILKSITKK